MKQVIVMAAGLGSRLKEITKVTPKSLIKINDKPILERNIEFMIEAKIDRVILILGYKREKFEYLISKYKDKIEIIPVYNEKYKEYNTLRSIYCVSQYANCDSWIVCADLYLVNNIYLKYNSKHNFYMHRIVKDLEKSEWVAELSKDNTIIKVDKNGFNGSIYSGVSYWPEKDIQFIESLISKVDWDNDYIKTMYWDEILFPYFNKFPVYVKHYDERDIIEIDYKEDLDFLRRFAEEGDTNEG